MTRQAKTTPALEAGLGKKTGRGQTNYRLPIYLMSGSRRWSSGWAIQ